MKFKRGDKVKSSDIQKYYDGILNKIGVVLMVKQHATYPIHVKIDDNSYYWFKEEELELVEKYQDKTTERFDEVSEEAYKKCEDLKVYENPLNKIREKDPEFYEVVLGLVNYLASTYGDKYEFSPMGNPSMEISLDPKMGKGANMFNAVKYLQRYCTEGFEKSNNPKDLTKAIHYILFQLQNHNRNNK